MTQSEIKKKIAKLQANLKNPTLKEYWDDFKKGIEKLETDLESAVEGKPKAKAKSKSKKKTATKKSKAEAEKELANKVGKTEEECEDILEQYKSLRSKAKARTKKATKTKEQSKAQGKTEPSGEKTPQSEIETATEKVEKKIEKKIEKVEKAEKPKADATPKAKAEAKKKVEKVVEKVADENLDAVAGMVKAIMEVLDKYDKVVAKKELVKLRDYLNKEIAKYGDGGMVQGFNIQEGMISVGNNTNFAKGGNIEDYSVVDIKSLFYPKYNQIYVGSKSNPVGYDEDLYDEEKDYDIPKNEKVYVMEVFEDEDGNESVVVAYKKDFENSFIKTERDFKGKERKRFEEYSDEELKMYNGENEETLKYWNRKDAIDEAVQTSLDEYLDGDYAKGGSIKDMLNDDNVSFDDFFNYLQDEDKGDWDSINSEDIVRMYIEDMNSQDVDVEHIEKVVDGENASSKELYGINLGNSMNTPHPINNKQDLYDALELDYYAKGGSMDDLGNPTDKKVLNDMEVFIENEIPKLDKEIYFTDGMLRKQAKKRFYEKYEYGAYNPRFSFDFAKGGSVNMNKHIWEGWSVGDFIEPLEISFQYQPKFESRNEVKKWAMSEQPYYKKYIPDVVNHFWDKSQNRHETWGFEKGGKIYKIQEKSKYDLGIPKWKDEKFQTGGKKYLSYKQAQEDKKQIQRMSSSTQYKVVEDISKSDYAKGGGVHTMPNGEVMLNSEHYAKGGMFGAGGDLGNIAKPYNIQEGMISVGNNVKFFKKGGKTKKDWVKKATGSPNFDKGAFTKKADNRGMKTKAFMKEVLSNPDDYTLKTRRQAQFMKNIQ